MKKNPRQTTGTRIGLGSPYMHLRKQVRSWAHDLTGNEPVIVASLTSRVIFQNDLDARWEKNAEGTPGKSCSWPKNKCFRVRNSRVTSHESWASLWGEITISHIFQPVYKAVQVLCPAVYNFHIYYTAFWHKRITISRIPFLWMIL